MKVYVKSNQGNYLMPTRPDKARWLLKLGRAKVINRTPFVIELTYDSTQIVQDAIAGIDDGGVTVGIAVVANNQVIYQEEVSLRTDIVEAMTARRTARRLRRNRKSPYRQARFNNRANSKKEWRLPPSIKSKKDAIVQRIKKLPLPKLTQINLEDAYFDTQAMENPSITGKDYQHGPMLYEKNYKSAAKTRDKCQCRKCGSKDNLEVHHLKPRSQGGTNKLSNLMTLCHDCHQAHHLQGLKLPKQRNVSYVSAAHVQQGKRYLQRQLTEIAPLALTFGYVTAHQRKQHGIEKSHVNDAVTIAQAGVIPDTDYIKTKMVQSRKRALHEAIARKGKKSPNTTQKRNDKNKVELKGFRRSDSVRVGNKVGFIAGFDASSAYVKDIDGNYIVQEGKKYKQMPLSLLTVIHHNQGCVSLYAKQ